MAPRTKTPAQLAKQRFKEKDRELIAAHHGVDADHPALEQLLIVAVTYELDPLMGHLWLVDEDFDSTAVKDGAPVSSDVNLKVGITRDGLLVVARRDARYGGMEFDVVREKDTFRTKRDGGDVSIFHEYPDLPTGGGDDGDPAEQYRGAIIGAYCKVFVEGHKPTYYFAFMAEHGVFETEDGNRIFKGAWRYQSTMIIKAAQSVTLRLAMGITGVVGIDEIKRGEPDAAPAAATASAPESPEAFLAGLEIDPEIKATLIEEVNAANAAEPNAWSLAKLRMRLGMSDHGALEDAAQKTLSEIDDFFEARKAAEGSPAPAAA
ncbi:MAG: recombinase RecT [Solirubrobacterales bacterium]